MMLVIRHVFDETLFWDHPDFDGLVGRSGGQDVVEEWRKLHVLDLAAVAGDQGVVDREFLVRSVVWDHSHGRVVSVNSPWYLKDTKKIN